MKKILHICLRAAAIAIVLFCAVSCVKDDKSNETSNLEAGIITYTDASDDGLALGPGEYVIRRCRLYAFDGNKLDNMVYFDNITTGGLGEYIVNMKVKQTTTKKLYCIVNEPDNADIHSQLALINNPAAFKYAEYAIADFVSQAYDSTRTYYAAADFCLPMFGESTGTFSTVPPNPSSSISVSLSVTRSLARVDIYLQTSLDIAANAIKIDPTTKLDILNTRAKGYFAPYTVPSDNLINITNAVSPGTTMTIPVRDPADNRNAVRVFTFYTPERSQDTLTELGFNLKDVDFNGVRKSYTVSVLADGTNPLTKIERNKSHKLICTFSPTFSEIIFTAIVTKWDDGGIDGDVTIGGEGNYHGGTTIIYPWEDGGNNGSVDVNN